MDIIERNIVIIQNDFERLLRKNKDALLDTSYMRMILHTIGQLQSDNEKFKRYFEKNDIKYRWVE